MREKAPEKREKKKSSLSHKFSTTRNKRKEKEKDENIDLVVLNHAMKANVH